jgi:hypothetical protein
VGDRTAARYFDAQRLAPFARHHALCDVRALRIAYEAAQLASASKHDDRSMILGSAGRSCAPDRLVGVAD